MKNFLANLIKSKSLFAHFPLLEQQSSVMKRKHSQIYYQWQESCYNLYNLTLSSQLHFREISLPTKLKLIHSNTNTTFPFTEFSFPFYNFLFI